MEQYRLAHINALQYMLAGKSVVTLKNEITGNRFTYHIKRLPKDKRYSKHNDIWWVKVLCGSDNDRHYKFIGSVKVKGIHQHCNEEHNRIYWYKHSEKSDITSDAQSVKVFQYVLNHLVAGNLDDCVSVYHDNKCGHCRRRLTVPSSVLVGLGPYCAGQIYKSEEVTKLMMGDRLTNEVTNHLLLAHPDPGVRNLVKRILENDTLNGSMLN